MESTLTSPQSNYRDFRFVSLPQYSPSFLMNNLTTNGGDLYAFANTTDNLPKVVFYLRDAVEGAEPPAAPQVCQWKDGSDCFSVRYLFV